MNFGTWLKERRKEAGFSLRAFAPKILVTPSYISKVESGELAMGEETLDRVAAIFSVPVDEVYRHAGRVPKRISCLFRDGLTDEEYARILEALPAPKPEPIVLPAREAWLTRLLQKQGLLYCGDWYKTRSLKTVRDIIRPASSTENGWGQVVVDGYGWTLYHIHAGEIAHAQWEEHLR